MRKPLFVAISSILLISVIGDSVHAQSATPASDTNPDTSKDAKKKEKAAVNLEQVIVTGTRTPKAIDEIPGAITVVSKEEIQHTLLVTEDATAVLARTVPGYAESSQAMSNTGETLRGRIPLRLFDGIPQGSPLREGTRNGTFTDMGVIGRVEVINGPSASEGIGAAGGIINYISKVPTKEGNETTITTRYQTQGYSDSGGWKTGVTFARKQESYDVLAAASYIDRGISYDGNGRRIGMNTSGSLADSTSKNLFLKAGFNFGENNDQRLQATYSRFKITGKGNYIQVIGCRGPTDDPPCAVPHTNTSEKGQIFGSKDAFNDFKQYNVQYTNNKFFGGSLDINIYKADQAMRYLPENTEDKQDPLIAPLNTLFDQSEITSHKKGIRTSWTRPDIFNITGLELHTGVDVTKDEAQQRLALTNRLWVPPMNYKGVAPYAQLSWDIGPLTFSGGYRREDDKLDVKSYTTTYYRNRVFVQGGGVKYKENLKNAGAIWRITDEWSLFGSYSEGFTLPNIGIPLRNINVPGQSVDRIRDLNAIIFKNNEIGFNWRGQHGAFGATHYISKSPFGASLAIDPHTSDFILSRAPVRIEGTELTGEWRFDDQWKVTGLYSRIRGKTAFWSADPAGRYGSGGLNKPMGVLDINPDKFAASVTWKFLPNADATLGSTTLFNRHISGNDVRAYDGAKFSYEEQTHGYTLFDLGVNYDMQQHGKLSLGVENLLDKQYILSWSQLAGYQNYWAGRGRVTSLTYSITL
ncbi:iron complex outermembrane receptor protein [Luteibacter rhizovicinus]|uniref:Iron complex outermembrane receptor protein n=1 Tax=Luteibacter rhizovicinus TaxID=242606 RepID=A0A4R3YMK6_9GAMM|nr:TonB-dependent receptor [Luteibacter rhizovicinus]TCV92728.1 iron complex outermembrane receptor protein [Luteibacter rhizovicinus]